MKKNTKNIVIVVVFAITLISVVTFYFFQKNSLKNEVTRVCSTQEDDYSCILNESIKRKSVKPCYILDTGINDKCIEEVYQTVDDKMLCADIFESGIKNNCEAYFSAK